MINTPESRENCARQLLAAANRVGTLHAFIGLDGFVDEIIHVVDKRIDGDNFVRVPSIAKLGARISAASGQSTNIEIVTKIMKLGGNGPIMANALGALGVKITYLGSLGYPNRHAVFDEFAQRAEVYTIGEPGHTDALEFEDGKIMLGKMVQLKDVNWANIESRFGRDKFVTKFTGSQLVGFVNWTMLPAMSDIWDVILKEICPQMKGPRNKVFFDLADPEKKSQADIRRALDLIVKFQTYFDAILGLNEKEAYEIGEVLGLPTQDHTPEGLAKLLGEIQTRIPIDTVVVHPVSYALAASKGVVSVVKGPFCPNPMITTGAGDHFNSGFCLGKLLGLDNVSALLTGVSTSGYYVRTAKSPSVQELAGLLRDWPKE
jgi:hypothetical protein